MKKEQPYMIFRGSVANENTIGNMLLDTAKVIHAGNIIEIDHGQHYIIVKKVPKNYFIVLERNKIIVGFEQRKYGDSIGRDSIGNDAIENCQLNGLKTLNVSRHQYRFFDMERIKASELDGWLNKNGYYPY